MKAAATPPPNAPATAPHGRRRGDDRRLPAYAALKGLASGKLGGQRHRPGAASLHDGRHSVGNVATLAMELVAVLLALALSHRRGQKLRRWWWC